MLYDLYKREVEQRAERRTTKRKNEETLRIAEELDRLSPEEKGKQSIADFFRSKLTVSDEEK
jgi:hypothetical protein